MPTNLIVIALPGGKIICNFTKEEFDIQRGLRKFLKNTQLMIHTPKSILYCRKFHISTTTVFFKGILF